MKTFSRHYKKIAIFSLSLALSLSLSSCQSQTPAQEPENAALFQESLSKAKRLNQDGSYALAELAARKAVSLSPNEQEAVLVLFQALRQQSDPSLQEEARNLATQLQELYQDGSEESKLATQFLKEQKALMALKSVVEAYESDSPELVTLLSTVSEENRNERYWRMAYLTYKKKKDLKNQLIAAKNWTEHTPTGLDAKEAKELTQADGLGLLKNPEAAFTRMRTLSVDEWKPFLAMGEAKSPQVSLLKRILDQSKVTGLEKSSKGLKVILRATNVNTKKEMTCGLQLAYSNKDGRHLLSPSKSSLSGALGLFADPRFSLEDDFSGIRGVFKLKKGYSRPVLAPLNRAFGQGEYKELTTQLSKKEREVMGESKLTLGEALLYDGGNLSVRVRKFDIGENTGVAYQLDILSPKYRLANGLGVGSNLSEFEAAYESQQVDSYKKRGAIGKVDPPIMAEGQIGEFGAYAVVNRKKDRGLLLLTDREGVVLAIRMILDSKVETGIF